ncbi:hypothetical protein LPN04_30970 [Rugamonas sp. A1-17]|nr:hypothetical protein [Rugamonas sp. A1-17]
MKYVLSVFFSSFGIAMLAGAWSLDPAIAQFKDFLSLLHVEGFWSIVFVIAMLRTGIDMIFSGAWAATVEVAINTVNRLRATKKVSPTR